MTFQRWFAPIASLNEDDAQLARTLRLILYSLLSAAGLAALILLLAGERRQIGAIGIGAAGLGLALWLTQRGYVRAASFLALTDLAGLATYLLAAADGLQDIAILIYPVIILAASLLLHPRTFGGLVGLTMIALGLIAHGQAVGWVNNLKPDPLLVYSDFLLALLILSVTALAAHLLSENLRRNLERARRNEQALRDSQASLAEREERYRLISTVTSDYMFSTRLGPDGQLHLTWVAGAFERITGYTFEAYVAHGGWLACLHPGDVEQDARDMAALHQNQPVITEVRTFHKNGRLYWVRVYAHPVWDEAHQRLNGIYGAVQDITLQRQAEATIHQLNADLEQRVRERTAQLEAANQELEAFSYSVSHDLRAPLRAMDGFARILLEDHASRLPDQAQHYLGRIRDGAGRMGTLIDDLLQFSRLGRQALTLQPVDTAALVHATLRDLQSEQAQRQIEIVIGDLPDCQADPALLKQVWVNLLSNAFKYTRQQPDARIEVGWRDHAYFVRDNGAGFDMRYADRLFGVFQRLHRAEEFEGTGVGLANVKRIIERHGGRIRAEAKPDQGATFYFTLSPSPEAR